MPRALKAYAATADAAVALGTFDGVHRGHQALLRRAQEHAQAEGLASLALTFSQPPGNYLGYPKPLLLEPKLKYALLETFVGCAVVAEFPELARMTPETFVEEVLVGRLRARAVVVGRDYRFGRDRAGDVALLTFLGRRYGFAVLPVDPVVWEGEPVSSSRIRQAVRAGQVELAAHLLGRPPLVCGPVAREQGLGRRLGYPTANVRLKDGYVVPEQGIFAGWACWDRRLHPAAIYLGRRPTFQGRGPALEAHLLAEDVPELAGKTLWVFFTHKLRDDASFPDARALQAQITADVARVRALLAPGPPAELRELSARLP